MGEVFILISQRNLFCFAICVCSFRLGHSRTELMVMNVSHGVVNYDFLLDLSIQSLPGHCSAQTGPQQILKQLGCMSVGSFPFLHNNKSEPEDVAQDKLVVKESSQMMNLDTSTVTLMNPVISL